MLRYSRDSLVALRDVLALSLGTRPNAQGSYHRLTGKVGEEDVIAIGHNSMRNAGFSAFASSTLELAEVLAFYGDLGAADRVPTAVGKGGHRIRIQTLEQCVGVCVTGLSA